MGPIEPYDYRNDPSVPGFADDRPIIVFDGHCAFCSSWARFVLHVDQKGIYRLLPAQSLLGEALYRHYGLATDDYETNILLSEGLPWLKSEGTIRTAEGLGFPWSLVRLARLLPLAWRDALYDLVARNRYRFLGRNDACFTPNPAHRERFLA